MKIAKKPMTLMFIKIVEDNTFMNWLAMIEVDKKYTAIGIRIAR